MSKLIIRNLSSVSDVKALDFVQHVLKLGRISNHDTQYCSATLFGEVPNQCVVYTDKNKKSDKFIVNDYPSKNAPSV